MTGKRREGAGASWRYPPEAGVGKESPLWAKGVRCGELAPRDEPGLRGKLPMASATKVARIPTVFFSRPDCSRMSLKLPACARSRLAW